MDIEFKTLKNGKQAYQFEFVDYDEMECTVSELKKLTTSVLSDDDGSEDVISILERLESRATDRYANDDYEVTSLLFGNEVATLTCNFVYLIAGLNSKVLSQRKNQ